MILNALTRRYDFLAAAGAMPRMGWTRKGAALCAELNEDGGVELLTDLRDEKGNARAMEVPEFIPHNNPPTPNAFYDTAPYALGVDIDKNGNPDPDAKNVAARDRFALHFKPHNLRILNNLENGRADPMTVAFRRFLEEWNPDDLQKIVQQQGNIKWRDFSGQIVVFRLADAPYEFLHQNPAASAAYEKWRAARTNGKSGVCMVTGKSGPIINSHPKILGDAYLVSFAKKHPAFSSHGWTQGENAPIGAETAHKYASVLNAMLEKNSGHIVRIPLPGGKKQKQKFIRIVFWPDSAGDDGKNIADAMGGETGDPFNRPDWTKRLRNFMERWRKGGKPNDPEMRVPFFILGLSENKARLSVRLWLETTLGDMRRNVLNFYDEADIGNDSPRPPLFLLRGLNNAAQDAAEKQKPAAPEKIKGEFFSAILSGGKYPAPLLAAALNRFQNDRQGNDEAEYKFRDRENARAALVKAVLIRNFQKEIAPMLNPKNPSVPYQLGRLFSVLESVQRSAHGKSPNATIRDRFIGGALSRPADVFPQLLKLAAHHMRGGHWGDEVISEIQNRIPAESGKPAIPRSFTLEEQGMFFLGYYHQREQNFRDAAAAKKRKSGEQLKNNQSAEAEKE